jgi:mono/diheme cytochrome c family protein
MRTSWLIGSPLGIAAIVIVAGRGEPAQDSPDLQMGREVFKNNCLNCHFVPDSTIERDKLWTQLIKTTA